MLLAKFGHDMDLQAWMKSGVRPVTVASMGALTHFRSEMAPEGSGTRCLVDCQIEDTCPFSAGKNYIEQGLWGAYAWEPIEHLHEPTVEQKIESLRTDNPFGRCVYRCDNDVVDHQGVVTQFEDDTVATHDMTCGTARPCRTIHLVGTKGEIEGVMEEGRFVVRHADPRKGHEYSEELVDLSVTGDGHGGGDMRLVGDFVRVLRGEPVCPSVGHDHHYRYLIEDSQVVLASIGDRLGPDFPFGAVGGNIGVENVPHLHIHMIGQDLQGLIGFLPSLLPEVEQDGGGQ